MERLHHQLDCGGSVRHEYDVEIIGVGIEETESALSYGFDALTGITCRSRMGVRIPKEIRSELASMAIDQ